MDKIHLSEIEQNKENKKRSLKKAQKMGLVAGSLSGGIIGGIGGGLVSRTPGGAAIGAVGAGLLANRYINRKNRKKYKEISGRLENDYSKYKENYNKSDEQTKKELRDRFENNKSLALQRDANRLLRDQVHQQRMIKYNLYMR